MADIEQMVAELEGGEPQPSGENQTPAAPETPGFDYFVGDQSHRVPENAEFAFKHNGEMARIPANNLINRYRQTAHLESKLKELTDKHGMYEKEVGDLDAWKRRRDELAPYESLQKWSLENPDAWSGIWEGYQKAQNGIMPTPGEGQPTNNLHMDALNKTINELRNQVTGLTEWKSSREKEDEEVKLNAEIDKIEAEAVEFSKKFERYGINLDETDEEGISLKGRILRYANDNGIGKFEIAAKTYLNDTLLERATQMGRQEGVKGAKGDVAAGIVSRSGVPPQGQATKVDVSRMSEADRTKAALAELEAAK